MLYCIVHEVRQRDLPLHTYPNPTITSQHPTRPACYAPLQLLVLLLQQPPHRLKVRLEGPAVPVRHVQKVDLLVM